jgi:hypothetical protein
LSKETSVQIDIAAIDAGDQTGIANITGSTALIKSDQDKSGNVFGAWELSVTRF